MKAVDIAKTLGVSKATVSLALNGKPGISEKTRNRILTYAAEMEQMAERAAAQAAALSADADVIPDPSKEDARQIPYDTSFAKASPGARPVIRVISPAKTYQLIAKPDLDLLPEMEE